VSACRKAAKVLDCKINFFRNTIRMA
jgi:hypothetical protein